MFQRKLVTIPVLVFAFGVQLVQASPSSQQFIQIHLQQQDQPGQAGASSPQISPITTQTTTLPLSTGGAINIDNASGQMQVNSLDPS